MDEVISGDWKDYAVQGEPETDSHANEACRPFTVTRHAAHVRAALDIVRDNRIRPAAINDISLFTRTELQVVFTSPFVWGSGSRYGCTQFTYDWPQLLKGKKVYWAEVVVKYKRPACRFLVTDRTYPNLTTLREYVPTLRDGPWWYDETTGTHYQNEKTACVEFMFDEDLYLDDSLKTEFVSHSNQYCCLYRSSPQSCAEFNKPTYLVGARFLGRLLGDHLDPKRLTLTERKGDQVVPSDSLVRAWKEMCNRVWRTQDVFDGLITPAHPSAPEVARGILAAVGHDKREERKSLVRLFGSAEDAASACARLMEREFGLTEGLSLKEDDDE